jgi:hypothetical protein
MSPTIFSFDYRSSKLAQNIQNSEEGKSQEKELELAVRRVLLKRTSTHGSWFTLKKQL